MVARWPMQGSRGVTAIAAFAVVGHGPAELFFSVRRAITLQRFAQALASLVVDHPPHERSAR